MIEVRTTKVKPNYDNLHSIVEMCFFLPQFARSLESDTKAIVRLADDVFYVGTWTGDVWLSDDGKLLPDILGFSDAFRDIGKTND